MRLDRALAAEFRKVFSTRIWWILAAVLFGYVAMNTVAIAFAFTLDAGGTGMPPFPPEALTSLVYSIATATGYVFPVIFGAMLVTAEVRYRTLATAFLAIPHRAVVLAAKGIVALLIGAVFGVVGAAASVGLGAPVLEVAGAESLLGEPDTWALIGRMVLAMALWGVVGVSVGVLVPSQIGSIVGIIAFTLLIEPILRAAAAFVDGLDTVGNFLPGAAGDALVGASIFTMIGGPGAETLEWWQGGLVLAGYAVVFGAIGAVTTWRRDVT